MISVCESLVGCLQSTFIFKISPTAVGNTFWSSDPKAFRFYSFGKPNTYAVESTPAKFSKLVVKRFAVSLQTKAVQHVYRVKTSSNRFVEFEDIKREEKTAEKRLVSKCWRDKRRVMFYGVFPVQKCHLVISVFSNAAKGSRASIIEGGPFVDRTSVR